MPAAWLCARVCHQPLCKFLSTHNHERCAPFIYDAWKSPEVLGIISKIAGIDLVPVMDWEIAHINIAVQSEEEKAKELEIVHRNADEGVADCALEEDDKPVVDWHTDSYPFVCVTMLSDCTTMVGGETMLRKGNGGTVKVRGPQMVGLLMESFSARPPY